MLIECVTDRNLKSKAEYITMRSSLLHRAGSVLYAVGLLLLAGSGDGQAVAPTNSTPTLWLGNTTSCAQSSYSNDWHVWLGEDDLCLDWRSLGPIGLRSPCGGSPGWPQYGNFLFTDCTEDLRPLRATWIDARKSAECFPVTGNRTCQAPWCGGQPPTLDVKFLYVCAFTD
jgi:hypothetical protein